MSSSEFLIIGVMILVLFGGKRLPQLLRQAGRIVYTMRSHYAQLKEELGWDELTKLKKEVMKKEVNQDKQE
ncbi:MAG: twin-arginine translocase TatA/TatE family subunit [Candidatus Electryoneaceae bacterium]|nr:twin-arginine translocase TatA/TatE family subunit [Candidatus Electryoneaceae bacterium]